MLSSFIPEPNLGNLPVVQLLCRALTAVCHLLLDEPHAAPFLGFLLSTASTWGLWLPWAGQCLRV